MVERSPALLPRLAMVLAVAAAGPACTSRVGNLVVDVTRSSDPAREPLGDGAAASIALRLDAPDFRVGPLTVPAGARQAELGEVPLGEGRRLTLEGLSPEGNVVSRGRSAPFRVVAGENRVLVFVGLTGTRGEFSLAPRPLNQARAFHSATLLGDGSLLLAGGTAEVWRPESMTAPQSALRSSERIDGSSLLVEPSRPGCPAPGEPGCMRWPRVGHSATLLASGNVLMAGGSNGIALVDTLELYQPKPRSFTHATVFPEGTIRGWHQAALCERGLALLGGVDAVGGLVSSALVYERGVLGAFPAPKTARRAFTLTALADGTLVATGGFDASGKPLRSIELLGPGAPAWVDYGPDFELAVPRAHHAATLLPDGSLLLTGGLSETNQATDVIERLDPSGRRLLRVDDRLHLPRWGHTASLLADGRVLVAGGFGGHPPISPTSSVEAVSITGESLLVSRLAPLKEARAGHTASRVGSDMLVVAGGQNGSRVLDSIEVFVY